MEKVFHANGNQKKAGLAILISAKIDFKTKVATRDKEGHYIMTKGSIQEDKTIASMSAPNIRVPHYKANVNRHKIVTIIVRDPT